MVQSTVVPITDSAPPGTDNRRETANGTGVWGGSKVLRAFLVLVVAVTGLACAENGGRPAGDGSSGAPAQQAAQTDQAGSVAKDPVELVFFDSRIFDEDLSSAMLGASSEITVNVPVGFSLNKIPERVDRWLYAIKENGGKVVAEPVAPKTRGLVSALIDVVVAIFVKLNEMRLYGPTENYDATLLYGEDGMVSKVVFDRR